MGKLRIMKTLKIIFIGWCSILCAASLYAQNGITVTVDGAASQNAKNMVSETITKTVNQSQHYKIATSSSDIAIAATVINNGSGSFEFLFKVTQKSENFVKSYNASTESGYADFDKIISRIVNQILTDLPKKGQTVQQQQSQSQTQQQSQQQEQVQGIKISGNVSNNMSVMSGVYIAVQGTSLGTVTDINGDFTITVPGTSSVLLISFVGYETQEITVGNRRIISVIMNPQFSRPKQEIDSDIYTPLYTPESTVRDGFELQSDLSFLFGGMGLSIGTNITANYRFNPNFALGTGFGTYFSDYGSWVPFFVNGIWNFREAKFSPFAVVELGICSVNYNDYGYYDYSYSGSELYLGAAYGFQYSFSRNFAIKASLKTAIGIDWLEFNIGLGVGVIYHF